MAKFDDEHRRRFIENLFAFLEAGGYDTFGELTSHWTQSLPVMLAAVRGIDAEDRDVMADVLKIQWLWKVNDCGLDCQEKSASAFVS